MLRQILDVHGCLPPDVHVTFQNTGKEMPETLEFIDACSREWGVPITWLEWDGFIPPGRSNCYFKVVSFATASRNGEPFDAMTTALGYLPNPTQRLCTANLKVKTGQAFMKSLGYDSWDNVMGIRADEPRRIARMTSPGRDNRGGEPCLPLAGAGVTKRVVGEFWRHQPFDLGLRNDDGVTSEGNCDLCFLKGANQVLSLIRKAPDRAIWWAAQEKKVAGIPNTGNAAFFRIDRPSYAQMQVNALTQGEMFAYDDAALVDCMCGD
jgi:3'-phosphoadenosine 5'-phosphosulfate sulfotransferase (PAPS reductase)/FAD synthetase